MRVRFVHPPVLRDLLLLAAVGAVVALAVVACAPESRDRMMHFFFEIPDENGGVSAATARESGSAAKMAFGNKWPQYIVSRHPPFVEHRCEVCHDLDRGNAPRVDQLTGCKSCHPAYFEYHRYQHGPAAAGLCVRCHDMHVSYQKSLLRAPQSELCTSCHAAQYDAETLETYHRDITSRDCTTCHDPHWSMTPRLLVPTYTGDAAASGTHGSDTPPGTVSGDEKR